MLGHIIILLVFSIYPGTHWDICAATYSQLGICILVRKYVCAYAVIVLACS